MRKIDRLGQRYGMLAVVAEAGRRYGQVAWLCKCDCGNESIVVGDNLRTGNTSSCGCQRLKKVTHDLTGNKFGLLTAIKKSSRLGKSGWKWECICECGTIKNVLASALANGVTVSCGCAVKGPNHPARSNHLIERNRHHGINRRAREKGAGGRLPKGVKNYLSIKQKQTCAICECYIEEGSGEVDHIVPLARGGTNEIENVQLLCQPCNRRKGAR